MDEEMFKIVLGNDGVERKLPIGKYLSFKNNGFIRFIDGKEILDVFEEKQKIGKIFSRKGQAEEFYKQQPFFYDEYGSWWLWDNELNYWKRLNDEIDLLNLIEESLNIDTISSKCKKEIVNSLKQVGRKQIPNPAQETWIQFKNGIIDVNNNPNIEIFVPNPYYFITNPLPYPIGENEDTPTIDKIFKEWVGEEYVKTLYEIIAYCLLPNYPINRLFCLVGEGLNGKSCFLRLLKKFIGEQNVTATELDILLNSRFEVTRLHKKLVCQMGETNFNEMNRTSLLKKLTGGDDIGFEYKNKTPFTDKNYAKIIISTNNLPTTSDKTIGFYRRWLIIDFPNRFSEKKDILAEIPEKEYENLSRKSVRLLRELLKKREFHNEGEIEDRMKRYEDRSDPLEKFLKEFTVEDYDGIIWKHEFEKRLNQWCRENRFRQMAENTIGKKMKEKGIRQELRQADWITDGHNRIRAWMGIKWKNM